MKIGSLLRQRPPNNENKYWNCLGHHNNCTITVHVYARVHTSIFIFHHFDSDPAYLDARFGFSVKNHPGQTLNWRSCITSKFLSLRGSWDYQLLGPFAFRKNQFGPQATRAQWDHGAQRARVTHGDPWEAMGPHGAHGAPGYPWRPWDPWGPLGPWVNFKAIRFSVGNILRC